ncbi:hypothetical protein AC792_10200 [Arthrobacter sp. RIT-PI-e]|uniref:hypothetical protein n=1 Tax=Arthrobacter sp. RIT-PI-e TaxID=1681197 RepID=UPI000676AF7C|nr:hypothetical protein [Arthrobacter sp. RIT-PI-e]KNC18784.1 hypothetical protein AC792_10200 [Arthrobacter sp. RIT-PI-e]
MTDSTVVSIPPRRSICDRLRTDLYLMRLDWHLEAVLPGKERRATIKELRQALAGDPRTTSAVLTDLGHPQDLARQYAVDERRRPLWSIGVITAGFALLVYWMVFLSFTFSMLAVVDSRAPMEADATIFLIHVTAFSTGDGVGIGWTSTWAWLVVPGILITIALLLGARAWRLVAPSRAY